MRALLLAALLLPFSAALGQSPTAPTPTLHVMSYNIHHGEGLDRKVDLARIARLITEARADLVGLQEVDRGCERTQRRDFPAELAQLTGLQVVFERNIVYQGGDYGNAVLSRFPIKRSQNTHYKMLRTGEQRGVLQLVLDVHGRDVLFMNTHVDFRPDDAERVMNAGELKTIVGAAGHTPIILVGDFNSTPGSRMHSMVKGFLADAWEQVGQGSGFTIPAGKPVKRIDYIFVSPGSVEPLRMDVLRSEASDHLPVLAELRLK